MTPRTSFYIATPEVDSLVRLEDSLRSVVENARDVHVTYRINDPARTDAVRDLVARWRTKATTASDGVGGVDIEVTNYVGLGAGDVLNRMLADVPYERAVVMTVLAAGSEIAPGALDALAEVMEKIPDVDLVRGLTATFANKTVLTALDTSGIFNTWLSLGAASGQDPDQPPTRGGVFWRAVLWHRLGGMDPSLRYASELDFCSKAAASFRLGEMEALLMIDRFDSSCRDEIKLAQQAEVAQVQLRAATRQKRLLAKVLDDSTLLRGGAVNPSTPIVYDHRLGCWTIGKGRQFLDLFGQVEMGAGFRDLEGPYPHAGLPNRFRWTCKRRCGFSVETTSPKQSIFMRIRNPVPNQAVALYLNDERIFHKKLESDSVQDAVDISLTRMFNIGRNDMALVVDVVHFSDAGAPLGVIVEAVEVVAVDQ